MAQDLSLSLSLSLSPCFDYLHQHLIPLNKATDEGIWYELAPATFRPHSDAAAKRFLEKTNTLLSIALTPNSPSPTSPPLNPHYLVGSPAASSPIFYLQGAALNSFINEYASDNVVSLYNNNYFLSDIEIPKQSKQVEPKVLTKYKAEKSTTSDTSASDVVEPAEEITTSAPQRSYNNECR